MGDKEKAAESAGAETEEAVDLKVDHPILFTKPRVPRVVEHWVVLAVFFLQ